MLATPKAVVTVRKSGRARRRSLPSTASPHAPTPRPRPAQLVHAVVDDVGGRLPRAPRRALRADRRPRGRGRAALRAPTCAGSVAELRHELLARPADGERRPAASRDASSTAASTSATRELFPPEVEALFVDTYETLVRVDRGARRRARPARRRPRLLPGEDRRAAERRREEAHGDRLARARAEPHRRLLRAELRGRRSTTATGRSAISLGADRRDDARAARALPLAPLDLSPRLAPPTTRLPSARVSAPAHTPSPPTARSRSAARLVAVARARAAVPRARRSRSCSVRSRSAVARSTSTRPRSLAAARGSFSDVVERALADDPARAGYLALLQPVVAWNDARALGPAPVGRSPASSRRSRRTASAAGSPGGMPGPPPRSCSRPRSASSRSRARSARWPLALAAMLALERALRAGRRARATPSGGRVYAVSAALLPLTHPIAASALAAQLVALAVARRRVDLRLALPAAGDRGRRVRRSSSSRPALDRADAPDGAGPLELATSARALGRGVGWSPLRRGARGLGTRRRSSGAPDERRALEGRARRRPGGRCRSSPCSRRRRAPRLSHARRSTVARGRRLRSRPGSGSSRSPTAALRLAALVAVCGRRGRRARRRRGPATSPRGLARGGSDRARRAPATRHRRRAPAARTRGVRVLRARPRTSRVGRGEAVTVVVAGDPARAVAAARQVVSPPRYALLEQDAERRERPRRAALGPAVALTSRADPGRRAEVGEHALLAQRPARVADAPAVPDQQVREPPPVGARDDALRGRARS